MKTTFYVATVAAALFTCALADAQVLGGAGSLGGGLSGGLSRQPGGMIQGSGQGTFGAGLDVSGVRRTTSQVGSRAAQRATGTAQSVRNRTRSAVGTASATGRSSAAAAVSQTHTAAASASAAGSLASNAQQSVAAHSVPNQPTDTAAVQPRQVLDVAASKQQAVTTSGNQRALQLGGQGEGSFSSSVGEQSGITTNAQGSGSFEAAAQRTQPEPAQQ